MNTCGAEHSRQVEPAEQPHHTFTAERVEAHQCLEKVTYDAEDHTAMRYASSTNLSRKLLLRRRDEPEAATPKEEEEEKGLGFVRVTFYTDLWVGGVEAMSI